MRTNTIVIDRDALIEELLKDGIEVKKSRFSPDGGEISKIHPSIEAAGRAKFSSKDKRFYVQDEASQIIACLVAPKPGEIILDACAAPGGKTTQTAAMMKNQGKIWALDKSASRLKSIEQTARRLGAEIIKTKQADAEKSLEFEADSFDAILLDGPCSGLGVLRRTPDIKWRIKEGDLKELSGRQKRLLDNLARYLKKGGRIIYSVCTLEPEEMEDVIKGLLSNNAGFVMENAADFLPAPCKALVDSKGFLWTLPHGDGCGGFFAARLKKL
ncbi:MAG: methyltransferase domain-containing protein [Deltaproteobacteria bacterium]|nr:methyltransferase domain-containing protein [Deltaproteobacteria bacterium]